MHVRFVVNILDTKNCTQSALKPHNKSPETRINAEFPSSIFLFKFNNNVLAAAVFICFIHVFIVFIIYIIYGFSGSQNFRYNFGTHHSVCPLPSFSKYKAAASS